MHPVVSKLTITMFFMACVYLLKPRLYFKGKLAIMGIKDAVRDDESFKRYSCVMEKG